MDLVDEQDLKDLYDEHELRIEEQDLRILKAILNDDAAAREFASAYDHTIFVGDAESFAQKVISYYKGYRKPPTRRIMLEIAGNDASLKEEINCVWDELDKLDYSPSEFRWDLDKIKDRFTSQKLHTIREGIEGIDQSDINYDEQLRKIRADLDAAEKIRKGKESVYTQKTLKEYMPEFRDEFVRKSKDPKLGRGLMTGYSYLDYVTNGLSEADMLIIGGETGAGKALPLDTLIPTPDGFKKLDDIHPGDVVFGRDGNPCNVVAESPIWSSNGWKFIFNDGASIISHDNHEWLTFNRAEQVSLSRNSQKFFTGGSIRTSADIAQTIKTTDGMNNHAVPLSECLSLPERNLLIDPYVLGLWLGDGHSLDGRLTTADVECKDAFVKAGFTHSKTYDTGSAAKTYSFLGLKAKLRELKLIGNKHIPDDYLWASKTQRIAIVQGLMDSDGFVSKAGQIEFVNTKESLAVGLGFLLNSLGEGCTITSGVAKLNGKVTGPKWTVRFSPHFEAFRLERKLERQKTSAGLNRFRYITKAIRINAVEMKCIQVDSNDHLFLATEHLIPTHNSMLLNNMAIQMWLQGTELGRFDSANGCNVQYFSLEMPYDQCVRRTMARLSEISTYGLRDCQITDPEQLNRLSKAANFIKKFPFEFEVVDIPRGVTIRTIEERYLEAIAKGRAPDVVVIDYLGLMEADGQMGTDDWLKLGHIAGQLHEFARTYNIILLSAVQLNRPKGKDPSDVIGLHRIGRSSLIMHHATVGVQIETRIDEETYPDMVYHIIKNRNGERGSHILKKNFKSATVIDMKPYVPLTTDGDAVVVVPAMEDISSYLDSFGWS